MNEAKKCKVSIFDEQYSLLSDESAERVVQAATLIDGYMREISVKGSIKDPKKVAVLAALRVASRMLQLETDLAHRSLKEADLIAKLERLFESSQKI